MFLSLMPKIQMQYFKDIQNVDAKSGVFLLVWIIHHLSKYYIYSYHTSGVVIDVLETKLELTGSLNT